MTEEKRREVDDALISNLALLHALEAAICRLSRHPQATDRLLEQLYYVYGDISQLEREPVPRND